jgi:hypothetical protein
MDFANPSASPLLKTLLMIRKKSTPAGTKRRWRQIWRIQPVRAKEK